MYLHKNKPCVPNTKTNTSHVKRQGAYLPLGRDILMATYKSQGVEGMIVHSDGQTGVCNWYCARHKLHGATTTLWLQHLVESHGSTLDT